MVEAAAALKMVKKALKKSGESMTIKALSKIIVKEFGNGDDKVSTKVIKQWISESSKFELDGKMVSLIKKKKKRKSESPHTVVTKKAKVVDEEEDDDDKASDATTNSSSKSNTDNTSADTSSGVQHWRNENKIVLRHATEDQELTEALNKQKDYFPFTTFDSKECRDAFVPALLRQCTEGNAFSKPSPIQAQSWPLLLGKTPKDIVGIAETGSGKTLAFGLPALSKMYHESQNNKKCQGRRKPRMLVLAPTRELAMQSDEVLTEFGAVVGLKSLTLYGGVPKQAQVAQLKQGQVDCLVATPGRIKDLLQEGSCDLSEVRHLVLDEADRMMDQGFEEDVRYIISQCPSKEKRHTAMFSATWPAAIQDIAMNYMNDVVRVYVGFEAIVGSNGENSIDDSLSANKRVTQIVEVIEDRARESRLRQLLEKYQKGKRSKDRILIFALYKMEAERLESSLRRLGLNVCSIHGNKQQAARTAALAEFKNGNCPLMVATGTYCSVVLFLVDEM
jgi:ATP-dependent RNA helicase DBP3